LGNNRCGSTKERGQYEQASASNVDLIHCINVEASSVPLMVVTRNNLGEFPAKADLIGQRDLQHS
jgi:hypothetical protein